MADLGGLIKRVPSWDSVVSALDQMPATHGAISPFVPGDSIESAVTAVEEVSAAGMTASVAYLPDREGEASSLIVLLQTIDALDSASLADGSDLMVDLAALGLARGVGPEAVAVDLGALCGAAEAAGMTVTLDGLAYEFLAEALAIHAQLADDHPDLGITIAANLLRSEADSGDLGRAGARVRLVRQEPVGSPGLAFTNGHEIDKSYVRCARLLISSGARTTIATHDPRLIEIASALAVRSDREAGHLSFQFRLGVRKQAAADLVSGGAHVGVLIPFGPDWPGYMARRIALKPRSVGQAARAAVRR